LPSSFEIITLNTLVFSTQPPASVYSTARAIAACLYAKQLSTTQISRKLLPKSFKTNTKANKGKESQFPIRQKYPFGKVLRAAFFITFRGLT